MHGCPLQLGVGNSELQLDMAMSGYTGPIISVDFSPTAIADLSLKHEVRSVLC